MNEIKIPRELTDVKTKIVGPFTLRQAICGGLAAVCLFLVYKYVSPLCDKNLTMFIMMIVGVPFAAVGFVPPSVLQGMYFEQYVKVMFINMIMAPQKRKYKTVNKYDYLFTKQDNELIAEHAKKKPSKKEMKEINKKLKEIRSFE